MYTSAAVCHSVPELLLLVIHHRQLFFSHSRWQVVEIIYAPPPQQQPAAESLWKRSTTTSHSCTPCFLLTPTHLLAGTGSPTPPPPFPSVGFEKKRRARTWGLQAQRLYCSSASLSPHQAFQTHNTTPQYTVSHSGLWREGLLIPQRKDTPAFSHTHIHTHIQHRLTIHTSCNVSLCSSARDNPWESCMHQ